MWLVILLATLLIVGWRYYKDERDFYDYLRAMRAEREREAMQWFALWEERERADMERMLQQLLAEDEENEIVNWKREGF